MPEMTRIAMVNHHQSADIGLDRISISTSDFTVADSKRLTLVSGKTVLGTGNVIGETILWSETNGKTYSGEKAFYNGSWFTLEIKPLRREREVKLFIDFNAAKCIRGTNVIPVSLDELRYATGQLFKELTAIGITLNPLDATLSSIEVAQNVLVDQDFDTYRAILKLMHFPRMARIDKDASITWRNTRRKFIVYDKAAQSSLDYGLLRFETQFKKAAEIRSRVGIGSLRELLCDEAFNKFIQVHTDMWKKAFEGVTPTSSGRTTPADLILGLEASKSRGGQWAQNFWKEEGQAYWAKQIGYDEVLNCISHVGNRNMVSSVRKEVIKAVEVSCQEQLLLADIQAQLFGSSDSPDD